MQIHINKRALTDFLIKTAALWKLLPYVFRHFGKTPTGLALGLTSVFLANILNGRDFLVSQSTFTARLTYTAYRFFSIYSVALAVNSAVNILNPAILMPVTIASFITAWATLGSSKLIYTENNATVLLDIAARASLFYLFYPVVPVINSINNPALRLAANLIPATIFYIAEKALCKASNKIFFDDNSHVNRRIQQLGSNIASGLHESHQTHQSFVHMLNPISSFVSVSR
ncbi:MAG: hypothetical protein BGO27_07715 [Alphaproteobacteria bacterium 33-17]|nr:MAG: hypothetical protein BGO27_07715 [Alphaproteobacteria bacterium 33-17]